MGVLVSSRFVITVFQFERQGEASMVIPDILRSKIAYFLTFIYLNGMRKMNELCPQMYGSTFVGSYIILPQEILGTVISLILPLSA